MDFCGTQTCNLQLSTLMLCHLSEEAHPAGMATSPSLRAPFSTQMLLVLIGLWMVLCDQVIYAVNLCFTGWLE